MATKDAKLIQSVELELSTKHSKEFACVAYDGLLAVMHKSYFDNVTPEDSLRYNLTRLHRTRGSANLAFVTPGSLLPAFPTALEPTGDSETDYFDVNIEPGSQYMTRVVVLAGAQYLDRTEDILPTVHQHDGTIARMAEALSKRDDLPALRGHDVLDSTRESSLTQEQVDDMFQKYFPDLMATKDEYVLYITCTLKAALSYVLPNLHSLGLEGAKGKQSLLVGPRTFELTVDNCRLNVTGATGSACARMLFCNDNKLAFSKTAVDDVYGRNMSVTDPCLIKFNETLEKYIHVPETVELQRLPFSRYAVSMMCSFIVYDCPVFIPLPTSLRGDCCSESSTVLLATLRAVSSFYVSATQLRSKHQYKDADQTGGIAMGLLRSNMYSPAGTGLLRSLVYDGNGNIEGPRRPWPTAVQTCTKSEAAAHLIVLSDRTNHVFHTDYFMNGTELQERAQREGCRDQDVPSTKEVNKVREKAIMGSSFLDQTRDTNKPTNENELPFIHDVFVRLACDPCLLKRFLVCSALMLATEEDGTYREPATTKKPLQHPKATEGSTLCDACGSVPFTRPCLCFLVIRAFARLGQKDLTSQYSVVNNARKLTKVTDTKVYNGSKTTYKAVHSLTVNELQSKPGYFGMVHLAHKGKPDGFERGTRGVGTKKSTTDEKTVEPQNISANPPPQPSEEDVYMRKLGQSVDLTVLMDKVRAALGTQGSLAIQSCLIDEADTPRNAVYDYQFIKRSGGEDADARPWISGVRQNMSVTLRKIIAEGPAPVRPLFVGDAAPSAKARDPQIPTTWRDDYEDQAPAAKTAKAGTTQLMEDMCRSLVFYDHTLDEADTCKLSSRLDPLIKSWKAAPQTMAKKFAKSIHTVCLGEGSIASAVAEAYLKPLPDLISRVHGLVAELIGLAGSDLDNDFEDIVHFHDKIKRELITWVDPDVEDLLTRRSLYATVFQYVRHYVDSKKAMSKGVDPTPSGVQHALSDIGGPHVKMVNGDVGLHTIYITAGTDHPRLGVNPSAATDAKFRYKMMLPLKLKVALNAVGLGKFDKEQKTEEVTGPIDPIEMIYQDDRVRFQPSPLLARTIDSNTSAIQPRSLAELHNVLRDKSLRVEKVRDLAFSDVSALTQTVDHITSYLSRRSLSRGIRGQTIVSRGLLELIGTVQFELMQRVMRAFQFVQKMLPDTPDMDHHLRRLKGTFFTGQGEHRPQINAIEHVLKTEPILAGALYYLLLCCELYAPEDNAGMEAAHALERDFHTVHCLVAGSLRLFLGKDDCSAVVRKTDVHQARLVNTIWSYLTDAGQTFSTGVDISRKGQSQMMTNVVFGSYSSSKNPDAMFTAARGGAPFRAGTVPNKIFGLVSLESEHNHVLCRPLIPVDHDVGPRSAISVQDLLDSMSVQSLISYAKDTRSFFSQLCAFYTERLEDMGDEEEEQQFEFLAELHRVDLVSPDAGLYRETLYAWYRAGALPPAFHNHNALYEDDVYGDDDDEEYDHDLVEG